MAKIWENITADDLKYDSITADDVLDETLIYEEHEWVSGEFGDFVVVKAITTNDEAVEVRCGGKLVVKFFRKVDEIRRMAEEKMEGLEPFHFTFVKAGKRAYSIEPR